MTLIKICGITNFEDARAAVNLGADLLGFIFTQSLRRIEPEAARRIISRLKGKALMTGVFSEEESLQILEIAKFCRLDAIQIHCHENKIDQCLFGYPLLKLLKIEKVTDLVFLKQKSRWTYLLEGAGRNKRFDWKMLEEISQRNFFLAGGLSVDNIEDALKIVRPLGGDVCSGIESFPGKKDLVAMEKFIRRVREWDQKKVFTASLADALCQKF